MSEVQGSGCGRVDWGVVVKLTLMEIWTRTDLKCDVCGEPATAAEHAGTDNTLLMCNKLECQPCQREGSCRI
jgi:hypothetical protein